MNAVFSKRLCIINNSANREELLDRAIEALHTNDSHTAVTLCQQIVDANPADAEAWSFLGLGQARTDIDQGLASLQKAIELEPQDGQWHLNLGLCLLQTGDYVTAERACRRAVELSSGAVNAIVPWADALASLSRLSEASEVLRKVVELEPTPANWRRLAHVNHRRGDLSGAMDAINAIFDSGTDSADDHLLRARINIQSLNFDAARADFDALSGHSSHPDVAIQRATFERARGNAELARELLGASLVDAPENARLVTALLDDTEVSSETFDRARALADSDIATEERRLVTFALARALDQAGDFDEAWTRAVAANALYEHDSGFDITRYERQAEAAFRLSANSGSIDVTQDPDLIYLVGSPETGGSLVQTLLASGPETISVGERGALLPFLLSVLEAPTEQQQAHFNARVPQVRNADVADLQRIGAAIRYIDHVPNHIQVLGLLARIHPGARFIDSRRDIRDVALSIFFQGYSPAFDYARSLNNILAFLKFHRNTARRWVESGVPVIIHDHEAFISAPETAAPTTFAAQGIDYDAEFLTTLESRAIVRTGSVNQAREAMTPTTIGRWQHYSEQLAPFFESAGL